MPATKSRLSALVIGPLYLLMISGVLSGLTKTPLFFTLPVVLAGAVAIMAVLTMYGVRMAQTAPDSRRFGLWPLLLIFVPLSLYLGALRWLLRRVATAQLDLGEWLFVGVMSAAGMILTTAVLLWFAEALVWLAVKCVGGKISDGRD